MWLSTIALALGGLLAIGPHETRALTWTAPVACQTFSIAWDGGTAPFYMIISAVGQVGKNVSIDSSHFKNGHGNYSMQMTIPQQQQFLFSLSDASGFNSLGTSMLLTVANGDTSCSQSSSAAFTPNYDSSNLQQCQNFVFNGLGNVQKPITFFVLQTGNTNSFDFSVPTSAGSSYTWTATLSTGTQVIFVPQDAQGAFGQSSDYLGVGQGSDSSCLASRSTTSAAPSRTASSPASSGSNTSGGGGGGGGNSDSSGGSNTGAIVGGVVGGVVGALILLGLVFFLLRRRRNSQRRYAGKSGFDDGAFGGGKNARRSGQIDLLPTTNGRTNGAAGGARAENDRAAQYPLSGPEDADGDHGRNDYEPVPYVLPPVTSAAAGSIAGRRSGADGSEPEDAFSDAHSRPLSSGAQSSTNMGGFSTYTAGDKAAMASMDRTDPSHAPNAPARFIVHEDAGSAMGDDGEDDGELTDEDEVVDLPPQYNSLGVLVPPERRPSRRRSTRRPEGAAAATAPGSTSATAAGGTDGAEGSSSAALATGSSAAHSASTPHEGSS